MSNRVKLLQGQISYKGHYKYQLVENYDIAIPSLPTGGYMVSGRLFHIHGKRFLEIIEKRLWIFQGYAWDGPSGPTIDTKDSMRASLVHDALYQLIREGHLPQAYRKQADILLREIAIEDGMWRWRAWGWYWAVRKFGGKHNAKPRPVHTAP